jgi:hypothetical protein
MKVGQYHLTLLSQKMPLARMTLLLPHQMPKVSLAHSLLMGQPLRLMAKLGQ